MSNPDSQNIYLPKAFISCSVRKEDQPFVDSICKLLEKYNIQPFGTVGKYFAAPEPIANSMDKNIDRADMVVVCATPRYFQKDVSTRKTMTGISEMIHVETGMAFVKKKPLIVFVQGDTNVGNFIPSITQYVVIDGDDDFEDKKSLIESLLKEACNIAKNNETIEGTSTVENEWDRWSISPKGFHLATSIVLADRDKQSEEILRTISRAEPCIRSIQAQSKTESLAFCLATIKEKGSKYLNKSLVIKDSKTLEKVMDRLENNIIITDIDIRNTVYNAQKKHIILHATCFDDRYTDAIQLQNICSQSFVKSLQESGMSYEKASNLSRKTGRSIPNLRHQLGYEKYVPQWAKSDNIRDLIPAILIGQWYEKNCDDKELIETIANEKYEQYEIKLRKWLNTEDSPLVYVDGFWKISSPKESILLASRYFTTYDWESYGTILSLIADDIDPEAIEKYQSTEFHFWKNHKCYSGKTKEGVFNTAILISELHQSFPNTPKSGNIWIDEQIQSILKKSNLQWWLSFEYQIPLIAEAAPFVFVKYIENEINKEDSIIIQLFTVEKREDSLWNNGAKYTNILFALEELAWDEQLLLPICQILLKLSLLKNESNYSNSPLNTLESIFKIWHPQTFANIDVRNQCLKTLSKANSTIVFELCAKLIKSLNGVAFESPKMKWRFVDREYKTSISNKDLYSGIYAVVKLMIDVCDLSDSQIMILIDLYGDVYIDDENRKKILNYLKDNIAVYKGNVSIYEAIIKELNHHRSFPTAQWALSPADIELLENLKNDIAPQNPQDKYIWMFSDAYLDVPEIRLIEIRDFKETEHKKLEIRGQALSEILNTDGIDGIYQFSQKVQHPASVGEAFAYICNNKSFSDIIEAYKNEQVNIDFIKGYFLSHLKIINSIGQYLEETKTLETSYSDLIYIPLISIAIYKEVYEYVSSYPKMIQSEYWKNVNCWPAVTEIKDFEFIIEKFNEYERFDGSVQIIESCIISQKVIDSQLILKTIRLLINSDKINYISQYYFSYIINYLDSCNDVKDEEIVPVEFLFYDMLKHQDNVDGLRFVKALLTEPELMMELISMIYVPETEENRNKELSEIKNGNITRQNARISFSILYDFNQCPYVDPNGKVDIDNLKTYISKLRELGEKFDRFKNVNYVIGQLLANYPENDDFPNEGICQILETLNNKDIFSGYKIRMYNKRGVTVRPAFSGGYIEKNLALKYKKYADKIRYTYPQVAEMFDRLSKEYENQGCQEDNNDKIEELDY